MKVVIVAKTRMGSGACIGAVTFEGQSLRLLAPADNVQNGHFNLDYTIGDVWDITAHEPDEIILPHVESVVVTDKRRLPPMGDLCQFIMNRMPPHEGGVDVLFEGLAQTTRNRAQYIAERTGIPSFSTMFWRPDRPLPRVVDESVRIRYCYPTDEDGRTLTFVGFQEPLDEIPAGALLRVSLAHWWRPKDKPDDELRCYVQLSGWYEECSQPVSVGRDVTEFGMMRSPSPEKAWALDDAGRELQRVFGFESFRPSQRQVIENLAVGRDTLAVMPTGSGKSLCYQLPATLFPGLTVVVSPLIALMEDQVVQLRELDIPAAFLNSTMGYDEQFQVMQAVRRGRINLLYAAPETLVRPEIMQLLEDVRVDCLAIDEAHCISEWGHDFRPEYRQLGDMRRRLSGAVCLALTATATARVREDIKDNLGIPGADEIVTSFDRDNLFLAARERRRGMQQLVSFLNTHRGESGLIYCLTRNDVDRITADLQDAGWPAIPYHAGLDNETRRQHHHRFTFEEDAIVVATIAFGMGINKSNVRFVVHFGLPKDVESYYQQIGRAGRDGLRADCLLLYSQQDIGTAQYHINKMAPEQRAPAATRLREMTDYAEATQCRRRPLLRYFDEAYERENCGLCDNCLATPQETVDLTIAAQKFLSCVKRTGEMFGAGYIIDVLRGSRSQKVLKNEHDRLSTYGIGREYTKEAWQELARQFVEQGLLKRDRNHGGLSVTAAGSAVLRGETFNGIIPQSEAALPDLSGAGIEYDRELFELLRVKRTELAEKQGVPSFVIFSDRSLQEMATGYPQSTAQLLQIQGMGEAKLGRYGAVMLETIVAYCEANDLQPSMHRLQNQTRPRPDDGSLSSRQRLAARLFSQGHSIDEISEDISLRPNTILAYLEKAIRHGHHLPDDSLDRECSLPDEELDRALSAFAELGSQLLRPVFDKLEEAVSYDQLKVVRLIYLNRELPGKEATTKETTL